MPLTIDSCTSCTGCSGQQLLNCISCPEPSGQKICRWMSGICVWQVSYCQGMAFVAGVILMYLPEEPAFSVLTRLMGPGGTDLRTLFLPGAPPHRSCLQRTLQRMTVPSDILHTRSMCANKSLCWTWHLYTKTQFCHGSAAQFWAMRYRMCLP